MEVKILIDILELNVVNGKFLVMFLSVNNASEVKVDKLESGVGVIGEGGQNSWAIPDEEQQQMEKDEADEKMDANGDHEESEKKPSQTKKAKGNLSSSLNLLQYMKCV